MSSESVLPWAPLLAGLVLVRFGAMEFTKVALLASNLASKILSAGSLAKVGGAASSSILAGLPSLGLTLPSSTALAGATSTLGSLVGTLKGSFLLGSPAAALSTLPVGAKAAAVVVGGASTVVAVPVVLGAVGFTSTGITASSLAAKMMSISAIANGGGVAAGSLVATLQSVGASGLSLSSKLLVSFAGSTLVSTLVGL
ncbi:PREDICTED: interferon alpha-inducible protein 27, mitochondrial isoform X1 [Capra hircus]|nr:PREDICTED: interferon alpha-inducible protein 27, mitochondrial isoform X1 [Capra hircus]